MKKEYKTPEQEIIKISTVSMLADSLTKNTEGVNDENDVLAPIITMDDF